MRYQFIFSYWQNLERWIVTLLEGTWEDRIPQSTAHEAVLEGNLEPLTQMKLIYAMCTQRSQ
jgi:hypothetical protein